jgi:hypothetical protein
MWTGYETADGRVMGCELPVRIDGADGAGGAGGGGGGGRTAAGATTLTAGGPS